MSANDPYWRLFEADSVPAPAYETASDMRAALSVTLPEFGNPDAAAASPSSASKPDGLTGDIVARAAEAAYVPEPVVAQVPALEDAATEMAQDPVLSGPAPVIAAAPAALADPSAILVTASIAAPRPPTPVSGNPSVLFEQALADLALSPFAEPSAPAQPRIVATEVTEESLALGRTQRIDLQRRLALAGFDPRGYDGIFGANTRSAIADFQAAWGYPATGYLEGAVVAELNQRTEDAYVAMRKRAAEAPNAAPVLASVEPAQRPERDAEKCARRSDGRIIERQSLACDMAGFAEQFVSLGRTSIGDEHEDAVNGAERIALASTLPEPGIDR